MTEFIVDIEMTLSIQEIELLKKLADKLNSDVPTVARKCMMTKCQEWLDGNLGKVNKRIKKGNVSDKTSKRRLVSKDTV